MESKFRNLNVDLPKQRLVDERPWTIAGLMFAVAIVLFIFVKYLNR